MGSDGLSATRWPDRVAGEGRKHNRDLRSPSQTLFECHPPFPAKVASPSVKESQSSPLVSRVQFYSFPPQLSTVDFPQPFLPPHVIASSS